MVGRPETLAGVLSPLSEENFFTEFWGKKFLHLSGDAQKFSGLFPWQTLNNILEQHRLDFPRLRLAKDGKGLGADACIRYQPTRRGPQIPRLRQQELLEQLRLGATLIIDGIEEIYPPIRVLAENLERSFHEYIQVNMYAGWGHTKGFDIHWDDHDVVVMQVFGQKDWKIYGETRKHPLFVDKDPNAIPPSKAVWKRGLKAGDLLYIPEDGGTLLWH